MGKHYMRNNKTVFILGAGASKADDMPLQKELLQQIFSLHPDVKSESLLQLAINKNDQMIMRFYEEFQKQRQILADFIIDKFASYDKKTEYFSLSVLLNYNLQVSSDTLNRMNKIVSETNVTLEDLFTLFDKIISGHEHFQGYTTDQILDIHKALRRCIIFLLAYKSAQVNQNSVYRMFAKMIFDLRLNAGKNDDVISILTMNWDALLERELFLLCQNQNLAVKSPKIYPDLCFYDNAFRNSKKHLVSTHVKARGYRNIKLLKLHGSVNWLICPYCGRVYVDYEEDIAIYELAVNCACPECKKLIDISNVPQMHSILITPTFLKDLNTLNIKNIWHNALIDLSEAKHVVFIGYSFPDADFEMRYLLKKAIQPGTRIEVILHNYDNPNFFNSMLENSNIGPVNMGRILSKLNLPEIRYTAFFGSEYVNFNYCGFKYFIEMEMEYE
jgi:NAD-dependent SIR2 family protein deacetylase